MSSLNCIVCGAACTGAESTCSGCQFSPEWQDLFQASRVAGEQCKQLRAHRLLSEMDVHRVEELLASMRQRWSEQARQNAQPPGDSGLPPRSHCRTCNRPASESQRFCTTCGGLTGVEADRLRHMDFTLNLFKNATITRISTEDAQRCIEAVQARTRIIETQLKAIAARPATRRSRERRNIAEILLDPRSIRWLLGSGGVLLAVGLVIFLSSMGLFRNATVVASAMGIGTLAIMAGGIAMIRLTRHSLAGRSMALLGCLVMPLNLWFYNSNHLVTLDGHLWIAAMICCALYAAAAIMLEDPIFVYVLFGGITMTGMLVLADLHRLAEVSAPATLLMTLGLISLHAERAFADNDGPFSRKRFGQACFWSAHVLIAFALTILAASQCCGWATTMGLAIFGSASFGSNQVLSFALLLVAAYAYFYSSLAIRRQAVFSYAAIICLLWAELLGLQIGHLSNHLPVLLLALAITSLTMNIAGSLLSQNEKAKQTPLASTLPTLGFGLVCIGLLLALLPALHPLLMRVSEIPRSNVTWIYAGALLLIAASSRIAASLNARQNERLSVAYLVATAGATFIAAASVFTLIGGITMPIEMTVMMVIPTLYLLASHLHRDGPAKRSLPGIAGAAAVVLLFSSLVINSNQWLSPIAGQTTDLWIAAFSLETAIFFAVASSMKRSKYGVYLATVMVCGIIHQILGFWAWPLNSYSIVIAAAGIAGLSGQRLLNTVRGLDDRIQQLAICANGLISCSMVAAILSCLSVLAAGRIDASNLWTLGILSFFALVSAALVPAGGVRRWYFSLTVAQIAVGLLTLAQYSTLSLPRKFEAFSVMAGLALLVVGYGLWYREQVGESEGSSVCLLVGALMTGLPPAIFAIINRFGFDISFVNELALVTVAVLMFLTGMMTRVRATTLIGGGLLICHLITLVVFAGMKAQLAVGAYVAIGGAVLFAVGLLLSIYRDRLLTLPQRIRDRRGLFRVLSWS